MVFTNVDKLNFAPANAVLCFDERRDCVHHFVGVCLLARGHTDTDLALIKVVVRAHFAHRRIEGMTRPVDDPAHMHPFLFEGAHSIKLQHHSKHADDHDPSGTTLLERRRHFLDLEALDDVPDFDIVVALKSDSTFEASCHVGNAVLEAAQ
jgi:hypothetical protein